MGFIIGSSYFGSATPLSSTANVELIQQHKPVGATSFASYKFEFVNVQACKVTINGSAEIYLNANQGFTSRQYDAPINLFTVVDSGITYTYIGRY